MTNISNFCDTSEDQGLSERSCQFSLDVEDPNKEREMLGYASGGVDLDRPYIDEPLAFEEWHEQMEDREWLVRLGRCFDGTKPVKPCSS